MNRRILGLGHYLRCYDYNLDDCLMNIKDDRERFSSWAKIRDIPKNIKQAPTATVPVQHGQPTATEETTSPTQAAQMTSTTGVRPFATATGTQQDHATTDSDSSAASTPASKRQHKPQPGRGRGCRSKSVDTGRRSTTAQHTHGTSVDAGVKEASVQPPSKILGFKCGTLITSAQMNEVYWGSDGPIAQLKEWIKPGEPKLDVRFELTSDTGLDSRITDPNAGIDDYTVMSADNKRKATYFKTRGNDIITNKFWLEMVRNYKVVVKVCRSHEIKCPPKKRYIRLSLTNHHSVFSYSGGNTKKLVLSKLTR